MVSLELQRQPPRQQPSRYRGNRRARQQQEPAERLAVDDEVHADAEHHAADQAARDTGGDAEPDDLTAVDHARPYEPGRGLTSGRFDKREPAPYRRQLTAG